MKALKPKAALEIDDDALDGLLDLLHAPREKRATARSELPARIKAAWRDLRAGRKAPSPAERNKHINSVGVAARRLHAALANLDGYSSGQLWDAGWRELLDDGTGDHSRAMIRLRGSVKQLAGIAELAAAPTFANRPQDRAMLNVLGHPVSVWMRYSERDISAADSGDFAAFVSEFLTTITTERPKSLAHFLTLAIEHWRPIIGIRLATKNPPKILQ